MIEFTCPSCQKHYRVNDELAGKTAKCKQCGGTFQVPMPVVPAEVDEYAVSSAPVAASVQASAAPIAAAVVDGRGTSAILSGNTGNFEYEISQRPDFALVTVKMQQGQKVFAEPSAMASMTPSVTLKAGFKGGLGRTIGRALGGESLIINTFTADQGPGEVTFAAGAPGDAAYYRLQGNTLYVQRGAFMLHSEGVDLTGKWQGAKGFFSGEGLVLLKASGTGDIFFNSYGAILQVDVTDQYIVDTGYIVAFEDTLQYRVTILPGLRAGGKLKSFFFGGEGLVCQFSGQGKVWVQTRHVHSFLSWVHPFRPASKN
ncbi:MAG: TIGR00266 family protein [Planctomycetaceae bacterium]|nr:TIGR00266 family protein [Planctomycetaceae bacterium]